MIQSVVEMERMDIAVFQGNIDGITSGKFISEELVHHVGLITSENTMFQGTIMENLTAFDETKVNDGFADTIAPGIKQRIASFK